jgi:hypothetical protein
MSLRRQENQPRTTQCSKCSFGFLGNCGRHSQPAAASSCGNQEKATNGNLAASGAEQHVPVLTTSHDQLAVLRPAFFLFLSLCGQLSQKTTRYPNCSGSDKRCCLFTVGSSYFHGPILDRIRPANRAASKFSCDLFPKDRFFHVHNFN